MKVYQVRERIGGEYHIYEEFNTPILAQRYISGLDDPAKFDIKVVEKKRDQ